MKPTVTKEFTFDCAHMLAGHEGLCQNLHGHTYKLQVEVRRAEEYIIKNGPSEGMVVDFKDLKNIVKQLIVDEYDHAFITYGDTTDETEKTIAKTLVQAGKRVVIVPFRPTAENFAAAWAQDLDIEVSKLGNEIVAVRVWETPTSYAEVRL